MRRLTDEDRNKWENTTQNEKDEAAKSAVYTIELAAEYIKRFKMIQNSTSTDEVKRADIVLLMCSVVWFLCTLLGIPKEVIGEVIISNTDWPGNAVAIATAESFKRRNMNKDATIN